MTPHVSPEFCRRRRRRRLTSPAATASAPARGEGAATLPNELVGDILSRLSVRSVCRFRCVSKEWSALISDPAFAVAHKSRHPEPLILVSHLKERSTRAYLQLMDMDGNIVTAIKGTYGSRLISTSTDYLVCAIDHCDGAVHVIDPASGKVLLDCQHFGIYGFGRAFPSGKYKVVCIKIVMNMNVCGVSTLGEDPGWRISPSPPPTLYYTRQSPIVVNGVMYFLATRVMINFTLHRFDLESEEWKKRIKGPTGHEVSKRTKEIRITELNRTLCIVQSEIDLTHLKNNEHVNIWLLTDPENDLWIKAYSIPMAVSTYDYTPLRITRDGGELIFHCKKGGGGELRVYDPDTKTCTSLWKLDKIADTICLCNLSLDRFVQGEI